MKLIDVLITIVCGEALAVVLAELYPQATYVFIILIPLLTVAGMWALEKLNNRVFILFQLAKHVLVGVFAMFIDLETFQFISLFLGTSIAFFITTSKALSFLIAAIAKFIGNKYWVFEKMQRDGIKKELLMFFIITIVGLLIDLAAFIGFSCTFNVSISVILAAIVAAVWNFLGYKFIAFKA